MLSSHQQAVVPGPGPVMGSRLRWEGPVCHPRPSVTCGDYGEWRHRGEGKRGGLTLRSDMRGTGGGARPRLLPGRLLCDTFGPFGEAASQRQVGQPISSAGFTRRPRPPVQHTCRARLCLLLHRGEDGGSRRQSRPGPHGAVPRGGLHCPPTPPTPAPPVWAAAGTKSNHWSRAL